MGYLPSVVLDQASPKAKAANLFSMGSSLQKYIVLLDWDVRLKAIAAIV